MPKIKHKNIIFKQLTEEEDALNFLKDCFTYPKKWDDGVHISFHFPITINIAHDIAKLVKLGNIPGLEMKFTSDRNDYQAMKIIYDAIEQGIKSKTLAGDIMLYDVDGPDFSVRDELEQHNTSTRVSNAVYAYDLLKKAIPKDIVFEVLSKNLPKSTANQIIDQQQKNVEAIKKQSEAARKLLLSFIQRCIDGKFSQYKGITESTLQEMDNLLNSYDFKSAKKFADQRLADLINILAMRNSIDSYFKEFNFNYEFPNKVLLGVFDQYVAKGEFTKAKEYGRKLIDDEKADPGGARETLINKTKISNITANRRIIKLLEAEIKRLDTPINKFNLFMGSSEYKVTALRELISTVKRREIEAFGTIYNDFKTFTKSFIRDGKEYPVAAILKMSRNIFANDNSGSKTQELLDRLEKERPGFRYS